MDLFNNKGTGLKDLEAKEKISFTQMDIIPLLFRNKMTVQFSILLFAFLCLYSGVFYDLAEIWWNRAEYMHGFLILPIGLYLIWAKRQDLYRLTPKPEILIGLAIVLLAGGLLLFGQAGEIMILGGISLIGMLCGLVLLMFGWSYLKLLLFPILYLIFMVPVLDDILAPLHWPFQLMTAKMGVWIMQHLGFSALVERQYIFLPNITLEVANICSGVAYLVSIVAIGLPLGYLMLRSWWSRIALIISAIIISIIANWMRVVLIGIWAYSGGEIHGPLHIFHGMFVAWIAFFALFGGNWGLSKIEKYAFRKQESTLPPEVNHEEKLLLSSRWDRSWWAGIIVITFLGALLFLVERKPVPLRIDMKSFPEEIGEWKGEAADIQSAPFRVIGADQELFRRYRDQEGNHLQVYIAYLEKQYQGKEIIDYKTAGLYKKAQQISIQINTQRSITVNEGYFEEGNIRQPIFFWFDINGRVLANPYWAKISGTIDTILHGRTNGAFIMISENPSQHLLSEQDEHDMVFISLFEPVLRQYLP